MRIAVVCHPTYGGSGVYLEFGGVEIGALLGLRDEWQKVDSIRSRTLSPTGTLEPPKKHKPKPKRTRVSKVSAGPQMIGCTCGKAVGFNGSHKKRCQLSRSASTLTKSTATTNAAASPVQAKLNDLEFGSAMRQARASGHLRKLLEMALRQLKDKQSFLRHEQYALTKTAEELLLRL